MQKLLLTMAEMEKGKKSHLNQRWERQTHQRLLFDSGFGNTVTAAHLYSSLKAKIRNASKSSKKNQQQLFFPCCLPRLSTGSLQFMTTGTGMSVARRRVATPDFMTFFCCSC